eukprot:TRINITY_DN3755_c0_g1_i2.p1 TRINITY_DN3755_c0_g1~~TRINITY_DN3755_c0_g1_i2.p1  ORF type:complete len:699 (+),score=209.60 TRINITY_DN3755_c0_g1_i2:89-2185(+)
MRRDAHVPRGLPGGGGAWPPPARQERWSCFGQPDRARNAALPAAPWVTPELEAVYLQTLGQLDSIAPEIPTMHQPPGLDLMQDLLQQQRLLQLSADAAGSSQPDWAQLQRLQQQLLGCTPTHGGVSSSPASLPCAAPFSDTPAGGAGAAQRLAWERSFAERRRMDQEMQGADRQQQSEKLRQQLQLYHQQQERMRHPQHRQQQQQGPPQPWRQNHAWGSGGPPGAAQRDFSAGYAVPIPPNLPPPPPLIDPHAQQGADCAPRHFGGSPSGLSPMRSPPPLASGPTSPISGDPHSGEDLRNAYHHAHYLAGALLSEIQGQGQGASPGSAPSRQAHPPALPERGGGAAPLGERGGAAPRPEGESLLAASGMLSLGPAAAAGGGRGQEPQKDFWSTGGELSCLLAAELQAHTAAAAQGKLSAAKAVMTAIGPAAGAAAPNEQDAAGTAQGGQPQQPPQLQPGQLQPGQLQPGQLQAKKLKPAAPLGPQQEAQPAEPRQPQEPVPPQTNTQPNGQPNEQPDGQPKPRQLYRGLREKDGSCRMWCRDHLRIFLLDYCGKNATYVTDYLNTTYKEITTKECPKCVAQRGGRGALRALRAQQRSIWEAEQVLQEQARAAQAAGRAEGGGEAPPPGAPEGGTAGTQWQEADGQPGGTQGADIPPRVPEDRPDAAATAESAGAEAEAATRGGPAALHGFQSDDTREE